MELLQIARRPAVSTRPDATVRQVAEMMMTERVGAVVVVEGGKLVGIISERDVVGRVVVPGRDPQFTLVSEVMTADVKTVALGAAGDQALEIMHRGRFRHLPIVDGAGQVAGMLSVRDLLRTRMNELDLRNADLVAFISADGPGG